MFLIGLCAGQTQEPPIEAVRSSLSCVVLSLVPDSLKVVGYHALADCVFASRCQPGWLIRSMNRVWTAVRFSKAE
jgi:hypothetical protein